MFKGGNSHVHRGFPGKLESNNLSRDNVRREIGRTGTSPGQRGALHWVFRDVVFQDVGFENHNC